MVGPDHSEVESRFSRLRQKLDDGGYLESFGLDSLRLVEHLYNDLVQTTESFQKTLVEYGRYKKISEELEEGVAPFKEDNVRLYKENSQLRVGIARALEEAEDTARDPLSRMQDLESENNDLKLLVSQFAERVKKAEADSLEKTKRIAKLQEKDLAANVFVAGDRGKNGMPQHYKQSMEVEYFVPDVCPQCIRLRNFVEYGKNSDRNPKAVDYMKLADSRIEALQLQIRSLKTVEAEHLSLIASLRERVNIRGAEIDKLRDLIKIRPGRDNLVNAAGTVEIDKMDRNAIVELKTAEMQLQILQRRNLELEQKLKKSILQEHDDYMLGRIPTQYRNACGVQEFLDKELDKYPSHDKMNLLEKLYYLERQLSHCCREKAVLKRQLDECRLEHQQKATDINKGTIYTQDKSKTRIGHKIGAHGVGLRKNSTSSVALRRPVQSEVRLHADRKHHQSVDQGQNKNETSSVIVKKDKQDTKKTSKLSVITDLSRKTDRIPQIDEECEESSSEVDNADMDVDQEYEIETNGNQHLESNSDEETLADDFEMAKTLADKRQPSVDNKIARGKRRLDANTQLQSMKQKPVPKRTVKSQDSKLRKQEISTTKLVSSGSQKMTQSRKIADVNYKESNVVKSRDTEMEDALDQCSDDDVRQYYSSAEDMGSEDDFSGNNDDDELDLNGNGSIVVAHGPQSQMRKQYTSDMKTSQNLSKKSVTVNVRKGKGREGYTHVATSKKPQSDNSKVHADTDARFSKQNSLIGREGPEKSKHHLKPKQNAVSDKLYSHVEAEPVRHDIKTRLRTDVKMKDDHIPIKKKQTLYVPESKSQGNADRNVGDHINKTAVQDDESIGDVLENKAKPERSTKAGIRSKKPTISKHLEPQAKLNISQKRRQDQPLASKIEKAKSPLDARSPERAKTEELRKQQAMQLRGREKSSYEEGNKSDEGVSDSDENFEDDSSVADYDDISFPSPPRPSDFTDSKSKTVANRAGDIRSDHGSRNLSDVFQAGSQTSQDVGSGTKPRKFHVGPSGDSRHISSSMAGEHVSKKEGRSVRARNNDQSANISSVHGRDINLDSLRVSRSEYAAQASDTKFSESDLLQGKQNISDNSRQGIAMVQEPSLLSISEFERNVSDMDDDDIRTIRQVEASTGNYRSQAKLAHDKPIGSLKRRSDEDQQTFSAATNQKRNDEIATTNKYREDRSTANAPSKQYTTSGRQPVEEFDFDKKSYGTGSIADREFNRAGGADGITSYGESSGTSYSRRGGGDVVSQPRPSRRGVSDMTRLETPAFGTERGNLNPTSRLYGNVITDRNVGEPYASVRSVAVNTDGHFDLPWRDKGESHEKKALQDKISALQRKLDDLHAESSQHQLKSFELQGELERTKHMYQVERQERELALNELRRIREQSNESTTRMLMSSALGSDGSFRKGATPMEMEREIANLRAALSSLDRDKDEMRVELDRKDEKLARVSHESSNYMDEISQLKLRLKNAELQINHTGESAKEQNREAEFLKKQLESNRRDFEKIIKERDEALKELHKLSGAHSKGQIERRSVESELEIKSKEADDLRRQVQRYIDEVRRIEELLLDKEEEMETIIQHYKALTAENSNLEAQRTSLEREASSIRESVRDTVDQNIGFKTQLSSQSSLVQSLEEEIQRLTQQITQLENQAVSNSEREKMLDADVKASKDLLYRLEIQMDKLKLDLADCDSKRKQFEAENTELNSHIMSLETRLQEETERQHQLENLVANSREKDFQTERTTLDISRERDELSEKLTGLQQRRVRDQLNSSSANYLLNTALGTTGSSTGSPSGGQFTDSSVRQSTTVSSSFRPNLEKEIQPRSSRDQSPLATPHSPPYDTQLETPTPIAASTSRPEDQHHSTDHSTDPSKEPNQSGVDEFEAWDSPK